MSLDIDEATCYLQAVLKSGRSVAHATLNDFRRAGSELINRCIVNARIRTGGIATGIGKIGISEHRSTSRMPDYCS